jgi:anti-sigma-K factor RskA
MVTSLRQMVGFGDLHHTRERSLFIHASTDFATALSRKRKYRKCKDVMVAPSSVEFKKERKIIMDTQQIGARTATRGIALRRWWWLVVGIAIVSAVFLVQANRVPPTATSAPAAVAQQLDAGSLGILNYIRVHESVLDHTPQDAATQGILNYIKVHQSVSDYAIRGLFKSHQFGPD